MKFITIRESNNATDLARLKDLLEANGIECRLVSEKPSQVINVVPFPFEELQVADPDVERAEQILRENAD